MLLRQAINEGRVFFAEIQVAFFGGQAHVVDEALLVGHQGIFDDDPEEALEFGNILVELVLVVAGEHQDFGGFEGLGAEYGGFFGDQAVDVADPPVDRGEGEDMLGAVFVSGKAAQAALVHKRGIFADIAFQEQEFATAQFAGLQQGTEIVLLLPGEMDVFGDVLKDQREFRHGSRFGFLNCPKDFKSFEPDVV